MIKREKIIINGMLLVAAILWGSSYAVRKIGLEHMGPFLFNGIRFFMAFIFVLSVYFINEKINIKNKRTNESEKSELSCYKSIYYQIGGGILVGIFFSLGANLQQWGLLTTSAGKVGFMTSLYTIFIPIISWVVLKKKIKFKVWFGAVLAFIGLALISTDGSFHFSASDSAIFISSILFAVQIILIGYFIQYSNPLLLVAIQLLSGTVISFIFAAIFESGNTFAGVIAGLGPLLYTGVFSCGVGNILQFYAQKKASPSVVAIIISLESVFGLIFSILLLGEYMKLLQLFGCILIFIAVIVTQYEKKPMNQEVDLNKIRAI